MLFSKVGKVRFCDALCNKACRTLPLCGTGNVAVGFLVFTRRLTVMKRVIAHPFYTHAW